MNKIILIFLILSVGNVLCYRFSDKFKHKVFPFKVVRDTEDLICKSWRPRCKTSPYRTIDGSCNNKQNPFWGTSFSSFDRLLPAAYSDDVSKFLKSYTGADMPNPRYISKKVFRARNVPDVIYNIANMQFGQIIAHDMSFGLGGLSKSCCISGMLDSSASTCDAIPIHRNDTVYSQVGWNCMDFIRNIHDQDTKCPLSTLKPKPMKPVSQISTATTFLELSFVYGDTELRAWELRKYKNGLMEVTVRNGYEWPPQDPDAAVNCFQNDPSDPCYLSSDARINSNPGLAVQQIYYLREHNRIARKLYEINPKWNDEKLYQEARRINIAQYQYVTYYEWLPIFLGEENMLENKLIYPVRGGEYVNDYNPNVKPVVYNEHANAAYRFFHSQIEGHLDLVAEDRSINGVLLLRDVFFKPKFVEKYFDDIGRGMIAQPMQTSDVNYDPEIIDYLFKDKRKFGDDLRAIDIQRGRDHGVARYNDFREYCKFKRAKKWEDYADFITRSDIKRLKAVYANYEDVELSVGAALEKIMDEDVQSGPTILCILNKQFFNTRISDRYFFESGDPEVRFTKPQLAEIRKTSYARLVCDNSNNIKNVQKDSFQFVRPRQSIVPCSSIQSVDLTKWRDPKAQ